MIKSLYENFRHWSNNGSIYLISDPHFNDLDCKLMNPNWIDPNEYVNKLNKIIHKNDTLICLGDCGDLSYIQQLKAGYKILIKGNHDDKGNSIYKRNIIFESYNKKDFKISELIKVLKDKYPNYKYDISDVISDLTWTASIDNNLFDEVYDGPLFISNKILLSHEPIYGLPFCINIHGHIHNGEYEYLDDFNCKHINITSDVVNWEVINLDKLIKNGIISNILNIHRLTINKAIENKVLK